MNLPGHRIAACLGKAALKTHALQTLPRGPLTRPRARSVWSASDLSALFVRRGTPSGSWSQWTVVRPRGLSMNRNAGLRHGLFSAPTTHHAVPEAGAPVRPGSWGPRIRAHP
jgi:hypothetical protein